MMMRLPLFFLLLLFVARANAREGMWIPLLLDKYNISEMQEKGFLLTSEDIFSVNRSSMKDAVVVFGGGCTGSMISADGLLITNHHCGFSNIQALSSVEDDYLTDGFWAMSKDEELINPGLKVTFLKRMEDVTYRVLEGVSDQMDIVQRGEIIRKNIETIRKEATEGTHYTARIDPFYHGNQYFLFVNEVFSDVRLVGAPPSAIGKFGGDTDNWMWPRHTGDFAIFRVYANAENQPADYSPDNIPYKPDYFFPISTKGVQKDDFTMVFGYPGTTSQYVPSYHLEMLTEVVYPKLVDVRTEKLHVMNHFKETDRAVRIQYASKKASVSNAWKRWSGEIRGLNILDAIEKKKKFEEDFNNWVNEDEDRILKYGGLFEKYSECYEKYSDYRLARDYLLEYIGRNGLETVRLAGTFERLARLYNAKTHDESAIVTEIEKLKKEVPLHFKDFFAPIDMEITPVLLEKLRENLPLQFHSDIFTTVDEKFKDNYTDFSNDLFAKTMFSDANEVIQLLGRMNARRAKRIEKDPAYRLYIALRNVYFYDVVPGFNKLNQQLDSLNRIYMQGVMAFDNERLFYPDANGTLRVAYGSVKGYQARDAVIYEYSTSLEGIMEKDDPEIYDYRVPERLKELHRDGDFGQYEVNGSVPVCFIATNHTTGGNSGSPVINKSGDIIGINFDRVWEGVMSDMMFNPQQCRNISVDIRYVLFIIDKFAGAGYLLEEMDLK
jgi:hypothetical protein